MKTAKCLCRHACYRYNEILNVTTVVLAYTQQPHTHIHKYLVYKRRLLNFRASYTMLCHRCLCAYHVVIVFIIYSAFFLVAAICFSQKENPYILTHTANELRWANRKIRKKAASESNITSVTVTTDVNAVEATVKVQVQRKVGAAWQVRRASGQSSEYFTLKYKQFISGSCLQWTQTRY